MALIVGGFIYYNIINNLIIIYVYFEIHIYKPKNQGPWPPLPCELSTTDRDNDMHDEEAKGTCLILGVEKFYRMFVESCFVLSELVSQCGTNL